MKLLWESSFIFTVHTNNAKPRPSIYIYAYFVYSRSKAVYLAKIIYTYTAFSFLYNFQKITRKSFCLVNRVYITPTYSLFLTGFSVLILSFIPQCHAYFFFQFIRDHFGHKGIAIIRVNACNTAVYLEKRNPPGISRKKEIKNLGLISNWFSSTIHYDASAFRSFNLPSFQSI